MSRVRRRSERYRYGATLSPWQRWCVRYGNASGFGSEADLLEAYAVMRDQFLEEIEDPAADFAAFWLFEADVPDELRPRIGSDDHVLLPEPAATERRAHEEHVLERRRAWLRRNLPG